MNAVLRGRLGWVVAFLGFPPAGALALLLVGPMETPLDAVIGGGVAGLVIGGAQLLALRTRFAIDARWVAATALGLAVGLGLSTALVGAATTLEATLLRAPLTGLLLGLAQWLVLRRYTPAARAWLPVVTLAYPLAWAITAQVIGASLGQGFVIFGASGALVFQVLTGLVLWRAWRSDDASETA